MPQHFLPGVTKVDYNRGAYNRAAPIFAGEFAMADSNNEHQQNEIISEEKWPVIISSSLQNSDIFTLLNEDHKFKVRGKINV